MPESASFFTLDKIDGSTCASVVKDNQVNLHLLIYYSYKYIYARSIFKLTYQEIARNDVRFPTKMRKNVKP